MHVVGHSVLGDDMILVTSDKTMIRQANKAIERKVYSLKDYKELIGL